MPPQVKWTITLSNWQITSGQCFGYELQWSGSHKSVCSLQQSVYIHHVPVCSGVQKNVTEAQSVATQLRFFCKTQKYPFVNSVFCFHLVQRFSLSDCYLTPGNDITISKNTNENPGRPFLLQSSKTISNHLFISNFEFADLINYSGTLFHVLSN